MTRLALVVTLGLAATAGILAIGLGPRSQQPAPASPDTTWTRLDANEPAPPFSLLNQNSRHVGLKDFAGKTVAMTFFFSHCTDVCPMQVHVLDWLAQELSERERDELVLVGITIDPQRDTPARLKAFLHERGLDEARWQLLTGSVQEASATASAYGIVAQAAPHGDFVHNSVYILIDAHGFERVEFHGVATPREEIINAIRSLIRPRLAAGG